MSFRRFHIDTRLSRGAALDRMRSLVRAPAPFRLLLTRVPDNGAPFVGDVEGNTFEFRRDIGYRNPLLPQISGTVIETEVGSRVEVEMWMHPLVMFFCTVWMLMALIGLLAFVTKGQSGSAVYALGMIAVGAGIMTLGFVPEAYEARRLITNAFEASTDTTCAN